MVAINGHCGSRSAGQGGAPRNPGHRLFRPNAWLSITRPGQALAEASDHLGRPTQRRVAAGNRSRYCKDGGNSFRGSGPAIDCHASSGEAPARRRPYGCGSVAKSRNTPSSTSAYSAKLKSSSRGSTAFLFGSVGDTGPSYNSRGSEYASTNSEAFTLCRARLDFLRPRFAIMCAAASPVCPP